MDKIRVNIVVIEPSDIVYQGLSTLLMKAGHDYFLYRLKDFEEIKTMYSRANFSIIIINPEIIQNRISDFTRLKKQYPKVYWLGIVYSLYSNTVLTKFDDSFSITEETDAILKIVKNGFLQNNTRDVVNHELSEREIDVLKMLTKGLSNKEIADKLNVSIHTVNTHRKNIMDKTSIRSLAGLTVYAVSKGIISLD